MRSYVARTKIAASIVPDQYTTVANGASVDLSGFDANVIEITTGAFDGSAPTAAAKIQDSVDGSSFADVADANLDGVTGNPAGFALAASSVKQIGYLGNKQYVRVILSATSGTTPIIRVGANVIRTEPKQVP
jgi:hypothetical protein